MNKRVREAIVDMAPVLDEFGAAVIDHETAGTGHIKLRILLKDGRMASHCICKTPSDRRSRLNDKRDLRRRLRELHG